MKIIEKLGEKTWVEFDESELGSAESNLAGAKRSLIYVLYFIGCGLAFYLLHVIGILK